VRLASQLEEPRGSAPTRFPSIHSPTNNVASGFRSKYGAYRRRMETNVLYGNFPGGRLNVTLAGFETNVC